MVVLCHLSESCAACTGSDPASAQESAREGAAARVATLAVTILTALNVHSQADKDPKIKPLLSAAWRVSHLTLCESAVSPWGDVYQYLTWPGGHSAAVDQIQG